MEELMRVEWTGDGELYHAPGSQPLGKGDIAVLPLADALSLIERGLAREVRTEISVSLAEVAP